MKIIDILFEEDKLPFSLEEITFTEKRAKDEVIRVIAAAKGSSAKHFSGLGRSYNKIEKAIKELTLQKKNIGAQFKNEFALLFGAEKVILTRVIQTAKVHMSLSKEVEVEKTDIDYEAVINELAKMNSELLETLTDLIKKYTVVKKFTPAPKLRIIPQDKKKTIESVTEGVKFEDIKSFVRKIFYWAKKFDYRLNKIKKILI